MIAPKPLLPRPAPCPTHSEMVALFATVEEACERRERAALSTVRPPRATKESQ